MKLKKIEKIEIEKTERFFRKALLFIVKHVFEFSLIALFLSLAIGVVVFYKYNILDQRIDLNNLPPIRLLEENSYQGILDVWEGNEQLFDQADSKNYRDMFSTKEID